MAKRIQHHSETRRALCVGADALANTVRTTLGPVGRNAVIQQAGSLEPVVTNDGATIAEAVQLDEPAVSLGARLLREATSTTDTKVGDGSTTSTVLAQAILSAGQKNLAAGAQAVPLVRGIKKAAEAALHSLANQAQPVTSSLQIGQVGSISSGDEQIGSLLAQASQALTSDGAITIEPSHTAQSFVEFQEGLCFDKGYVSPYLLREAERERAEILLEDAYLLTTDQMISSIQDLLPLLEQVIRVSGNLVIVSNGISNDVLTVLTVNRIQGQLDVVCVGAPGVGEQRREMLSDISVATGGQLITPQAGISWKDVTLDYLGRAKAVRVRADSTVILNGAGSERNVQLRIRQIQQQLDTVQDEIRQKQLRERSAKIGGRVAVIRVGAATEAERREQCHRIEDAVHATRAAALGGVVAGGGAAYIHAIPAVEASFPSLTGDERTGAEILVQALAAQLDQISRDVGLDTGTLCASILHSRDAGYCFDASQNRFGDMFTLGLLDPMKVVCTALEGAVSIATAILTTEAIVVTSPPLESPTPKNRLDNLVFIPSKQSGQSLYKKSENCRNDNSLIFFAVTLTDCKKKLGRPGGTPHHPLVILKIFKQALGTPNC